MRREKLRDDSRIPKRWKWSFGILFGIVNHFIVIFAVCVEAISYETLARRFDWSPLHFVPREHPVFFIVLCTVQYFIAWIPVIWFLRKATYADYWNARGPISFKFTLYLIIPVLALAAITIILTILFGETS